MSETAVERSATVSAISGGSLGEVLMERSLLDDPALRRAMGLDRPGTPREPASTRPSCTRSPGWLDHRRLIELATI